ncbi:hypothetical protein B566_EDAN002289 [Ephemera danica]|nr:hypothetical protein B566_EDAN002289 [Ephemera danica]
MDNSGSQGPPGEVDGCKSDQGSPLPSQEAAELDWTTATTSHLEQVEYVEEAPIEYGRASFTNFEPATPFSPQQSTSMDYEHRVSPLDPNMSSAARYSPVYSISTSLAVHHSPSHNLAISNPSSPFPGTVGIPNPNSPISSTNNPIDYRQRSHHHHHQNPTPSTSYATAVLRNPDSPIAGPSGLLRQAFFHSDRLTPSPSPQSPLQAPMTPSDNFVSSSTGPSDDTNPMMADTSDLRYLTQTSDSNSILDPKVDSTREVATPLHDSHEKVKSMGQLGNIVMGSSPPGSYGHEATPVDSRDDDEGIGKSPDSQHVEVLIGYETIRIVEPEARFIASAAESYLAAAAAEGNSMDPLVVALKGRGSLVFNPEGLTRAELLGLKSRGLLMEPGGSTGTSNASLPLLLDSSIAAGLKAEGLVLEDMPGLEDATDDGLEGEDTVLETLKTRSTLEEQQLLAAQCTPHAPTMDTDGNLSSTSLSCSPSAFCDDSSHMADLSEEGLSHLASHGVVLLSGRTQLEVNGKHHTDSEVLDSDFIDDSDSPLQNSESQNLLLRRSKRHQVKHDDDNDTWCDDCYEIYSGECPQHRVQTISDKPVPARAWASLPGVYLAISKLPKAAGMGVFARKTIPRRTQFGPLEGVMVKEEEFSIIDIEETRLKLTIELENGEFAILDTSSENHSNWMRFVRPARCYADMNLVISQQNGALFYTTTRAILPRQELQVGYGVAYAAKRNLPLLEPNSGIVEEDTENAWPCFECNELFSSSEGLEKHLTNHDNEREDEEEITKSRVKKTTRTGKRKVLSHLPIKKYKSEESGSDEGEFRCGTCSRNFPRSQSLKRHLLLHSEDNSDEVQVSHPFTREKPIRKTQKKDENGDATTGQLVTYLKQKNSGEEGTWLCAHCHLTFDTASMLNLHTLAHAAEDLEEQNMEDDEEDLDSSAEHTSTHGKVLLRKFRGVINPAKPYKCELCYKSFATEDRLQRHMLVHGTEESKPLQCETCFKRFLNNSALACHVKIHTEEKKSFECPICRTCFDQVMALKDHVHVHSNDGMFTCPHCTKALKLSEAALDIEVFEEYNQIRKHIRAFHSDKRFPCDICEKVFPRPDKLKLHMLSLIRKHIRAFHSERKHTCSSCGKLFPTLDKLRMHMLRHSDHREFLCANCGKQFKRKDKLKEHMKRMHSAEREAKLAQKPSRQASAKKFIPKCHSCLLGFKRRGMLVNHLAKRHPDISPESVPELNLPILKTTRDYYCQYCDKVYKSSSKRKAHILKNHPGLELPMSNRRKGGVPEIPGVPNPTFSQTVGSITTHPHGCPWCHKQYASKAKLLQHQRKKHPELLPHHSQQVSSDGDMDMDACSPPSTRTMSTRAQHNAMCSDSSSEGESKFSKFTAGKFLVTNCGEQVDVIQLTGELASHVNILPAGATGTGNDMLSQAMSELSQSLAEFRTVPVSDGSDGQEPFMKILHTGHIMVTQASDMLSAGSNSQLVDQSNSAEAASQLRQLLTNSSYGSLPPTPPPSTGSQQQSLTILPRGWAATFTSYTAR